MKKLLAILLVLALSLGMLPMALADEPTVLTIGSIITKRDLDKNVLIQRIAEKLNAKIEFTFYDTDQYSVMLTDGTLPDIMLSKYEYLQNVLASGLALNIEPYIDELMPNLRSPLYANTIKLQQTLQNFGVGVTVTNISCGPTVTRYELHPEQGVKVSKIVALADDIKLNLAATDIRIEAPIPGKAAIGIEVPNKENTAVGLRELLETDEFKKFPSNIAFAVGKDIAGRVVVSDIAKMPHLLIAGATGSGKSVCINTLIMSILYKAKPDDVKLIMVDPKQVELSIYNGIPHMLIPVVTDPKKAAGALNWAVLEMTNRYQLFAQYNVRNLQGYNEKVKAVTGSEEGNEDLKKLPQIVIIVDELADLMMVAHGEVEDAIVRLSQLARAAGIHLVIAKTICGCHYRSDQGKCAI